MNSAVRVQPPERTRAAVLVVALGALEDNKAPSSLDELDARAGGGLRRLIASGDFTGKRDETALFYPSDGPKRLLFVGAGPREQMARGAVRRAAAIGARKAVAIGADSMAFYVPPDARGRVTAEQLAQAAVEGAYQGLWTFEELRSKKESKGELKTTTVLGEADTRAAMERGRNVGDAIGAGHVYARNLQMRPGNLCTPQYLADEARRLGRHDGIKVTVMRRIQIVNAGLGGLLAVAQGSAQEPRFIVLEYRNAGRRAPICLVGKGVTFDTGGISLKPPLNMEEMKFDMSGAAAVLGTFEALRRITPKANVVGLIPATENMPSGTAIKPGDVIKTHLGKTVEVVNTDAEGRLILCDALSYARRFKPACIVDAATLTGAIIVVLGSHGSGVMGNDDRLLDELQRAGERAGERCWPLPLWDEYREQIKSDVADIKNTGGRPAGSITAGWFLREFVEQHPWAHVDIAGTAAIEQDLPHMAKGPTGVGVRLFMEFILGHGAG